MSLTLKGVIGLGRHKLHEIRDHPFTGTNLRYDLVPMLSTNIADRAVLRAGETILYDQPSRFDRVGTEVASHIGVVSRRRHSAQVVRQKRREPWRCLGAGSLSSTFPLAHIGAGFCTRSDPCRSARIPVEQHAGARTLSGSAANVTRNTDTSARHHGWWGLSTLPCEMPLGRKHVNHGVGSAPMGPIQHCAKGCFDSVQILWRAKQIFVWCRCL